MENSAPRVTLPQDKRMNECLDWHRMMLSNVSLGFLRVLGFVSGGASSMSCDCDCAFLAFQELMTSETLKLGSDSSSVLPVSGSGIMFTMHCEALNGSEFLSSCEHTDIIMLFGACAFFFLL